MPISGNRLPIQALTTTILLPCSVHFLAIDIGYTSSIFVAHIHHYDPSNFCAKDKFPCAGPNINNSNLKACSTITNNMPRERNETCCEDNMQLYQVISIYIYICIYIYIHMYVCCIWKLRIGNFEKRNILTSQWICCFFFFITSFRKIHKVSRLCVS